MIRLIVNADDLGSGALRDRGIFAAFTRGIVSSASLLANGPTFATATAKAIACGLPVGVHLNLSEGRPLSGPIPGLTGADGSFPGKRALREILPSATFDGDAVHRELLAQIGRLRDAGLEPDHLDTHQHCLLFPALTAILADVAAVTGIRALRLPCPAEAAADDPESDLGGELSLYRRLAPAARETLQRAGLWTPDGLWGMPLLNRLDEGRLATTLAALPPGDWELMTHPGYRDPADPFGGTERETELAALSAPVIRRLVDERSIVLTSFGACACAC